MPIEKLSSEILRLHKGVSFTGIATAFQRYDARGRLLLAKRGPQARDEQGTWDNGAGGLKWGSTAEDNVRREIDEEYGAKVLSIEFWGYRDTFRTLPDGTATHWLGLDFGVLVDAETVKNNAPGDVSEVGWFTQDNLPSPLHSQMPRIFKKYAAEYKRLSKPKLK